MVCLRPNRSQFIQQPVTDTSQAYVPRASNHAGVEMYQKGHVRPVFSRPLSRASEFYETEFEEDEMSDFEEYNGRTSEDSVGHSLEFG